MWFLASAATEPKLVITIAIAAIAANGAGVIAIAIAAFTVIGGHKRLGYGECCSNGSCSLQLSPRTLTWSMKKRLPFAFQLVSIAI